MGNIFLAPKDVAEMMNAGFKRRNLPAVAIPQEGAVFVTYSEVPGEVVPKPDTGER
jgi:hypothetical protein